jgi:hypothetical protein
VKDRVRELLICYGYGDGGGGPTDELIRKAGAYRAMPGAPQVVPSTVRAISRRWRRRRRACPSGRGSSTSKAIAAF